MQYSNMNSNAVSDESPNQLIVGVTHGRSRPRIVALAYDMLYILTVSWSAVIGNLAYSLLGERPHAAMRGGGDPPQALVKKCRRSAA